MKKTWKQRLREDIQTCAALPKKEKGQFIWDYYKVPILAVAIVLALAVLTVLLNTGRQDKIMYAVLINADETGNPAVFDTLLTEAGVDLKGKTTDVDARYSLRYDGSSTDGDTVLVLAALFGVGDLDVFAADERVFESYAAKDAFVDLDLFIPREELDRLNLYLSTDSTDHERVAGIRLSEGSPLHEAGFYTGDVIIGVAARAQNLDPAVEFMKQLVKILP